MAGSISKFDEDEILIIAGKLADLAVETIRSGMEDNLEIARNAASDEIEKLIRKWDGACTLPLPFELRHEAVKIGLVAAIGRLNFLLTEQIQGS